MISCDAVTFRYPKRENAALSDISLSIPPHEIFTLLGPNGAGKTTLLRVVSGLIIPKSGTVAVCGHNMRAQEHQARARVGLVLGEERSFYYRLSGAQNLEFFGGLRGIVRGHLRRRTAEVLALVGLANDAKIQYMRYSTGMKKRLALARALLHEPEVLLLDEPNSGIDPASARTIREILTEQRERGKTILLTTHDMTEAERLSDRIGFLKEGKLLKVGTLADYQTLSGRKRFEVEFGRSSGVLHDHLGDLSERIRAVSALHSIEAVGNRIVITYNGSFDLTAVLREVSSSGLEVARTNTYAPTLEDVFIRLARE